jgi:predicted metal-dependent phosphoesterase TrpH
VGDPERNQVLSALPGVSDPFPAKSCGLGSPDRFALAGSASCGSRALGYGHTLVEQMSNRRDHFAIDFHVHTSFSYDCAMSPGLVIDIARWRRLDGIAITDHDTVDGALAVMTANTHSDFLVIPGIEVKSDLGDVIGLYVDRQIESRQFDDVIREIHDKGGVAYVPHPMRTFGARRMREIHVAHPEIDLWEMYNGRYEKADFAEAPGVFEELGLVGLCGSDAHFPWEIGVFRTVLSALPRDAQALVALSRSAQLQAKPRGEIALSAGITLGAMTKALKRGNYSQAGRFLAALPWKAIKKSARSISGRDR